MKLTIFLLLIMFISSFSQTQMIINKYDGQSVTLNVNDIKNITFSTNLTSTVSDIDGNVYRTIKIGNQWWMAENLKVTHYRNGDNIPNITDNTAWSTLTTGAYCYYDNNTNNAVIYGALYNWYVVDDSRGIAPTGWHVPNDTEWQTFIEFLGGDTIAGGKLKEIGIEHWQSPNTGATDEFGFSAPPGGYRAYNGPFSSIYINADFWTSTEYNGSWAFQRYMEYNTSKVVRNEGYKSFGFSVRCVKD